LEATDASGNQAAANAGNAVAEETGCIGRGSPEPVTHGSIAKVTLRSGENQISWQREPPF
jgi:hypothetical protein